MAPISRRFPGFRFSTESRMVILYGGESAGGVMSLEDVFDYFGEYDQRTFEVWACQGNEPSEDDLAAFEDEVGFGLPDEFREFTMSPLGGLCIEVRKKLWPRPKAYDVGAFWSFLYGVQVFGISEEIPEWLDIREQYREFRSEGFGELVPFLQLINDPDKYCFDAQGRIVHWLHEEPQKRRVLRTTFSKLLMREIHELEKRLRRKLRGETS